VRQRVLLPAGAAARAPPGAEEHARSAAHALTAVSLAAHAHLQVFSEVLSAKGKAKDRYGV